MTRLLYLAFVLGLSLAPGPAAAQSNTGAGGDAGAVTEHVPVSTPRGPTSSVTVTSDTGNTSATGEGLPGTIQFGTHVNGSGGGDSGGSTGAPLGCVPTGVIVIGEVRLPGFGIVPNPPTQGVVGIPSWFWTANYAGGEIAPQQVSGYYIRCIQQQVVGAPDGVTETVAQRINLTLEVDVWPVSYEWDFGDGQRSEGSCLSADDRWKCANLALGRTNRAEVNALYQASSARFAKGYPIALRVTFGGRIGAGAGWEDLGTFDQFATLNYPVREIQSVLVP